MATTSTDDKKTCSHCGATEPCDECQAFLGCSGGGMSTRDPDYDEQCKAGPSGRCVQCRRVMGQEEYE